MNFSKDLINTCIAAADRGGPEQDKMKITVKFFSSLMEYLPKYIEGNAIQLDESGSITPNQVLQRFNVPDAEVRTMIRNGVFLPGEDRDKSLEEGDVLTVWPAIQGG